MSPGIYDYESVVRGKLAAYEELLGVGIFIEERQRAIRERRDLCKEIITEAEAFK